MYFSKISLLLTMNEVYREAAKHAIYSYAGHKAGQYLRKRLYSQFDEDDKKTIQMANKRRTYRRKASPRRKSYKKRNYRAKTRGRVPAKIYRAAVTFNPPKYILWSDNGVTGGNTSPFYTAGTPLYDAAPQILLLNPMTRGNTIQQRQGDDAWITKLYMRFQTKFGTAIGGDVTIQWLIFCHKDPLGAAWTALNFQQAYFGCQGANCRTNALPNINNMNTKRIDIIKRGAIHTKETVAGVVENVTWTINCPLKKPIHASYKLGNAGTIADLDGNALYLLLWTNNATATANIGVGLHTAMEGRTYFRD